LPLERLRGVNGGVLERPNRFGWASLGPAGLETPSTLPTARR